MLGPEAFRNAMTELASLLRERGVGSIQVQNPSWFENMTAGSRDDPDLKWVIETSEELGFHIADPVPDILRFMTTHGLGSRDLWVQWYDPHPSPARHVLIAKAIFAVLVRERLVPDAAAWGSRLPELLAEFDRLADDAQRQWQSMRQPGPSA